MVFLKHFYREKTHYLKGIQLHDITTLAHFKQNRQIYQNGENLYDMIGTNLEAKGGGINVFKKIDIKDKKLITCGYQCRAGRK